MNGTNNSDRITGKGGDGRIRGRVGNTVTYSSRIENIRGGSGNDLLYGCSGQNLLSGGGNSGGDLLSGFNRQIDILADLGRYNQQGINLPASNDVYTGFKGGSATWVLDTGGREDVVNLGNFSSSSVERLRVDIDGDGINGSLLMLFDDTGERGMLIINQFETDETGFLARGHIEKIKFKNTTISPSASSIREASAAESAALGAPASGDSGLLFAGN